MNTSVIDSFAKISPLVQAGFLLALVYFALKFVKPIELSLKRLEGLIEKEVLERSHEIVLLRQDTKNALERMSEAMRLQADEVQAVRELSAKLAERDVQLAGEQGRLAERIHFGINYTDRVATRAGVSDAQMEHQQHRRRSDMGLPEEPQR